MNFFVCMIRAFIVTNFFGSYAMDGIEIARSRRDIIAETCKFINIESDGPPRIIPIEKLEEINKKFENIIDYFHYDTDLKCYYVRFLFQGLNNPMKGINIFAEMILSGTTALSREFMGCLSRLNIDDQSLKKYVDEIVQGNRTSQKYIHHATSLLSLLRWMPTVYDATLSLLVKILDQEGHQRIASNLVTELYAQSNKEMPTPHLKALYAHRFLIPRKKYEKAVELYGSILRSDVDPSYPFALDPNNPYQTGINYNNLACGYFGMAQVELKEDEGIIEVSYPGDGRDKIEKGVILLETALYLDNFSPVTYQNLAFLQVLLGQYDSAVKNSEKLIKKPQEELTALHININVLRRTYEFILQKSGRTEELTSILLEKQRKIIDKHKKRVALIKEDQGQRQQEAEARQQKWQDVQQQLPHQPIKQVISRSTYAAELATLSEIEKGEAASSKKQKRKARKALQQSTPVVPIVAPPVEVKKEEHLIYIENLTESSSVKKTFDKLFSKYVTGQDEKISLNEISHFFKALDQDFDPSKGKGSHKKVTLNFQNQGIDMEEQMLILTNKTYLKPEQTQDIQLAFVRAGIVPNNPDVVEKLRKCGELG